MNKQVTKSTNLKVDDKKTTTNSTTKPVTTETKKPAKDNEQLKSAAPSKAKLDTTVTSTKTPTKLNESQAPSKTKLEVSKTTTKADNKPEFKKDESKATLTVKPDTKTQNNSKDFNKEKSKATLQTQAKPDNKNTINTTSSKPNDKEEPSISKEPSKATLSIKPDIKNTTKPVVKTGNTPVTSGTNPTISKEKDKNEVEETPKSENKVSFVEKEKTNNEELQHIDIKQEGSVVNPNTEYSFKDKPNFNLNLMPNNNDVNDGKEKKEVIEQIDKEVPNKSSSPIIDSQSCKKELDANIQKTGNFSDAIPSQFNSNVCSSEIKNLSPLDKNTNTGNSGLFVSSFNRKFNYDLFTIERVPFFCIEEKDKINKQNSISNIKTKTFDVTLDDDTGEKAICPIKIKTNKEYLINPLRSQSVLNNKKLYNLNLNNVNMAYSSNTNVNNFNTPGTQGLGTRLFSPITNKGVGQSIFSTYNSNYNKDDYMTDTRRGKVDKMREKERERERDENNNKTNQRAKACFDDFGNDDNCSTFSITYSNNFNYDKNPFSKSYNNQHLQYLRSLKQSKGNHIEITNLLNPTNIINKQYLINPDVAFQLDYKEVLEKQKLGIVKEKVSGGKEMPKLSFKQKAMIAEKKIAFGKSTNFYSALGSFNYPTYEKSKAIVDRVIVNTITANNIQQKKIGMTTRGAQLMIKLNEKVKGLL